MTTAVHLPAEPQTRRQRVTGPVLLGGAVLGVSLLLHVRDPHETGSYGFCPWLVLTGTYCPGCGSLRAVHDLTNGDLASAFSKNALFVGGLPMAVYLWGRWFADRWAGARRPDGTRRALVWSGLFLCVALVFGVVRNLEVAAHLAP